MVSLTTTKFAPILLRRTKVNTGEKKDNKRRKEELNKRTKLFLKKKKEKKERKRELGEKEKRRKRERKEREKEKKGGESILMNGDVVGFQYQQLVAI
jgi:hypothetical protein